MLKIIYFTPKCNNYAMNHRRNMRHFKKMNQRQILCTFATFHAQYMIIDCVYGLTDYAKCSDSAYESNSQLKTGSPGTVNSWCRGRHFPNPCPGDGITKI